MFTFKHIEAIYWVVEAGGFAQAAQKMHTTQSAVYKRVQEFESIFGIELFERNHRTTQLTEKGETMFILAKKILEQREMVIDQIGRPESQIRRLRMGITTLCAMTWLSKFCSRLKSDFPNIIFEPSVAAGVELKDSLLSDKADLIIVPDAFRDTRLVSTPVGKVKFNWMCKPGILNKKVTVSELASQQLLIQGDKSATGLIFNEWFHKVGLSPSSSITGNNLLAMVGMTIAGLGISYLPKDILCRVIETELLEEIESDPPLPEVAYVAMYHWEKKNSLISSIVSIIQECCEF